MMVQNELQRKEGHSVHLACQESQQVRIREQEHPNNFFFFEQSAQTILMIAVYYNYIIHA